MFEYRKATIEDLERIWDKDITENAGDPPLSGMENAIYKRE